MTDLRVIFTTHSSAQAAEDLVRTLISEGLIACGNIVPGVTSIYAWQGAIERAPEVLIILKTTAAAEEALHRRLPELHSYEVPELLALPVISGHEPYVAWLRAAVSNSKVLKHET